MFGRHIEIRFVKNVPSSEGDADISPGAKNVVYAAQEMTRAIVSGFILVTIVKTISILLINSRVR